jgi:hypothetical protein
MARVNARSEDHVKIQRPRTRGAAAAGETKRRATLQSPRHQTVMMARRFTAERCANASIPALRSDASTPDAPFKYSLLETSGTSPSSSCSPLLSRRRAHGSFQLFHRRTKLGNEMPWTPAGQQEQRESSCPVDARRRRPPAHRRAKAGRGEPRCPGGLRRPDPSGSCSELAVATGGGAGFPLLGEH